MRLKIVSLVIFLFLFKIGSVVAEENIQEWIVYFSSVEEADLYEAAHPERVMDQVDEVLKVELSEEEKAALAGVVERIEPNYTKRATAEAAVNDPLFPQQWGLKAIHYTEFPSTFSKNELLGQEFTIDDEGFIYEGTPFSAESFSIRVPGTTLTRISVELEKVAGAWKLSVFDGDGALLGDNEGSLKKLDVLVPKKSYSEIMVVLEAEGELPQIIGVEGVNHSIVAVIDSGVALHEDFCGNVLYSLGKDFKEKLPYPEDKNGHGTHVTGILAACSGNGIGVAGVIGSAPIDILPLKVLDANGYGGDFEISKAVNSAIEHGVDLINLSIAGRGQTVVLGEAVRKALNDNIPIVAAAGNWNINTDEVYPASYPGVITVAGVTEGLEKVSTSNYGWEVDVSGPGQNIISTYLDNEYFSLNGTSMATPYVTGTLAMLKLLYPDVDLVGMRNHLFEASDDLLAEGFDPESGYGMVNMSKVLSQPLSSAGLEWLSLKNGQELHKTKLQYMGVSSKWMGKKLTVFANDVLVDELTIKNMIEEVNFSGLADGGKSTVKVLAIVSDDSKNIYGVKQLVVKQSGAAAAKTVSFSDVSPDFWAYEEIMGASQAGIINGYGDGSFQPNAPISRKHSVLMLNRLLGWEDLDSFQSPFRDVDSSLTASNFAIMAASKLGIIKGYNGDLFKPENPLTRGQMALILARALGLDDVKFTGEVHNFTDLSPEDEYYDEVQHLAALGIITKQPTYRPTQHITRAQFATMLHRYQVPQMDTVH